MQAMQTGGLSFVRVDASWDGIEPAAPVAGAHTYAWEKTDLFVAALARNSLRWYPMLGYSAPWASSVPGDPFAPPAGDADFASFVGAFAARYGTGGSFWTEHPELPQLPTTVYGIWNEPSNQTFWHGPEATPERYMRLYLAARAGIKAVDPAATVTTGGLLDSGFVDAAAYLRAMLDSAPGAQDQIDAVGWHPYVGLVNDVLDSIKRARTTLDHYELQAVPIEVSEVGWHAGFALEQRAQALHDLAMKLPNAGLNVTRLLPYVWAADPVWQIADPDGSPGLLGGAYFAGIRDAAAYQPAKAATQRTTGSSRKKNVNRRCVARKLKSSRRRSRKSRAGMSTTIKRIFRKQNTKAANTCRLRLRRTATPAKHKREVAQARHE
jgi:hypothetical protein